VSGAGAPGGAGDTKAPLATAICLFAFAEPERIEALPAAADAPATRPVAHIAGAIAAVVATVPLAEYCGPAAAHDLAWLAPRVHHHAAVLRALMQRSPVFPVPFGTLYTGLPSLTGFMRRHEATIAGFLRAMTGMQEWGLKATAAPAARATLQALAPIAWPEWPSLPPGTRYMRLCRERPALVALARARARQLAGELLGELRPLLADWRELALSGPFDEAAAEPVGNSALLVRAADAPALAGRLAALRARAAEQRITLALSGPWPPFSFRPSLAG
jgi:gas vesicle protein GvpL/GvpF